MKTVSAQELHDNADSYTIIDVRTPEEFEQGHIKDATLIDCYGDALQAELGSLDPKGTYVLYCRSGARSAYVVELLEQKGFLNVYNLTGGLLVWKRHNFPLI